MADEIDLNEEEEAALDRAWDRIRAQDEAKRGSKGEEVEPEPDEAEEE